MFNFMLKSSCTQLELPIYTNSRTKEMWLVSFNIDTDMEWVVDENGGNRMKMEEC